MKTSQKVILVAVTMITVLIFTTMIIVRNDIQAIFVNDKEWNFKTISVDKFHALDFSANYHAEVVSGMEYLVEVAVKDSTRALPSAKVLDGTLYFSQQHSDSLTAQPVIKVRITMPLLRKMRGRSGSEITIRNFQSDSLTIDVEKGCKLTGKENKIRFLTFQSGDALVEWINNP